MTNDHDPEQREADTPHGRTGLPLPAAREPVFNLPGVVIALAAACIVIHLYRIWLLTPQQDFDLILRYAFFPLRYSGGYALDLYAFLSPFTYAFLHGGVGHLAINTIWLAAFGSPLANRIGVLRFLLFWAATSLAAVALHYVLHSTEAVPLVGASGAISGMMGAAARFGFRIDRSVGKAAFAGRILSIPEVFRSRMAVTFLAVWFAVNLLMGLGFGASDDGGSIAWEAHIGGFLAGFLLVRAFDRRA